MNWRWCRIFPWESRWYRCIWCILQKNPSGSGYAIACGLEQVIDYIKNLSFSYEDVDYLRSLNMFDEEFLNYLAGFHFTGDIYAIPEGSVVFPYEPLVKVVAPIMEAQLVETALLNIVNHQSLIATKASRVCYAAKGMVSWNSDFAVRRTGCWNLRCEGGSYRWLCRNLKCNLR